MVLCERRRATNLESPRRMYNTFFQRLRDRRMQRLLTDLTTSRSKVNATCAERCTREEMEADGGGSVSSESSCVSDLTSERATTFHCLLHGRLIRYVISYHHHCFSIQSHKEIHSIRGCFPTFIFIVLAGNRCILLYSQDNGSTISNHFF
jgi:hypothetical protein